MCRRRADQVTGLLDQTYRSITDALHGRSAREFLRPTRARAWCVQDLLFHVLLDAQRALLAFATPTPASPDTDAVTYWRPFRPSVGDAGVAHARFVRIAASAYADPHTLFAQWRDTSQAALRAAGAIPPDSRVQTQGHVLTVPDFVSTLTVEAGIHYLDLTLDLPAARLPAEVLGEVRRVLQGLLGRSLPVEWDDRTAALKGSGRVPLSAADRRLLGTHAAAFPLLG